MCTFSAVFMTFDTVNLDINIHYVLRKTFLRYFLLRNFHKFVKFSVGKYVYAVKSPKFPSIWYPTNIATRKLWNTTRPFCVMQGLVRIAFYCGITVSLKILNYSLVWGSLRLTSITNSPKTFIFSPNLLLF